MKKIKVLVVDDSPFILELIKDALDVEDIKVVGTADNAHQALQLYRTLKPNVVTM
ncbi:MAG: response regulator, partial [Candidatus Saccharibacteria bacterium]